MRTNHLYRVPPATPVPQTATPETPAWADDGEDPTVVGSLPQAHADGRDTEATIDGGYKERFGRYLLIDRLGRGGMAEVFKAVAEGAQGFRRVFVVKRILPEFAGSPYFVSLFADEAKLSALLHHPNLVQVYEFGAVAGVHYLSMEYLDGIDLASVLSALAKQAERIPPSLAVYIAQQVAHGLAYAHAATDEGGAPLRLVHRDVSPENIMLMHAGTVKLVDFGIALSDQRLTSSITQGKVLKGKLAYASPEQVKGQPMDGRSDIFSLGVVLWEMLAGRRLFAADDDARTLYNVLERQVAPPSRFNAAVPAALDDVVLRALAREPSARHANADSLSEELDDVLRTLAHHRTALPQLLARVSDPQVLPAGNAPRPRLLAAAAIAQEETTDETTDLRIEASSSPFAPDLRSSAAHAAEADPRRKPEEVAAPASGRAAPTPATDPEAVVVTDMSIPAWRPRSRGGTAVRAALALAAVAGLLAAARGLALQELNRSSSDEAARGAPHHIVATEAASIEAAAAPDRSAASNVVPAPIVTAPMTELATDQTQ